MSTNFKIPPEFDKVIKKLYPELEDIQIIKVQTYQIWNPNELYHDERYRVHLYLVFKEKGPTVFKDVYGEMINQLFVYTYGDNDFVKFVVDDFVILRPQTKQQKFMDMFYVGG